MSALDRLDRRTVVAGALAGLVAATASAAAWRLPMPDTRLLDPPLPFTEGFAPGLNGAIYWRLYPGKPPGAVPAIMLHGGPAGGHRYLRPYAMLARQRPVTQRTAALGNERRLAYDQD